MKLVEWECHDADCMYGEEHKLPCICWAPEDRSPVWCPIGRQEVESRRAQRRDTPKDCGPWVTPNGGRVVETDDL